MKTVNIRNIPIQIVKKEIKNLHLWVYPPLWRVRVAVPQKITDDTVRLFVINRLPRIRKQRKKFKNQRRQSPRRFLNRETHYYLWKKYLMKVAESDRADISIHWEHIIFQAKKWETIKNKKERMSKRYRDQLKEIIPSMLDKREKKLWVKVNKVRIQNMKTKRWSCNKERWSILLNTELAKKPTKCIEYVMLHELIHFKERKHNDRFIAYLDKYMPTRRQIKDELNEWPLPMEDRIVEKTK